MRWATLPGSDSVGSALPGLASWTAVYLAVFPATQLLTFDVGGANAAASDAALAVLALLGVADLLRTRGRPPGLRPSPEAWRLQGGALFLVAFAGWVALGALWSYHPEYALLKGAGFAGLALGAHAIWRSRLSPSAAADAWLLGTGVALALTVVFLATGPDAVRERLIYREGSIVGLPFPRLRGPFFHPNLFGGYLAVSGALLWGRWPELRTQRPLAAWSLALGITAALLLSTSTGWLGAAVVLVVMGGGWARVAGVLLGTLTLVGVIFPLELTGVGIHASGIRPRIWASAASAVVADPFMGVGAAPYLAVADDPATPAPDPYLWDAHSTYLSVLGQYGLIGTLLLASGIGLIVVAFLHGRRWRRGDGPGLATARPSFLLRRALGAALLALAVHGVAIAGEEFRHAWALLGIVGLVGVSGRDRAPDAEGSSGRGRPAA